LESVLGRLFRSTLNGRDGDNRSIWRSAARQRDSAGTPPFA
jgi:hypothetical protein